MLKKEDLMRIIRYSGLFLLVFIANIILLTGISFIAKGSINYWQLPVSFLIAGIELYIFNRKNYKCLLIAIFLSLCVIFFSIFICSKFYDVFWDSNSYHKDAVGALANGWNPIYEDYLSFYRDAGYRDMKIIGDELYEIRGFWQTYYAKGTWIVNANFYKYTNNIESAKILNVLLIYITMTLVFSLIYQYTNKKILSFIVAILSSITSVTFIQAFSNYNDGTLYNTLLIFIISLLLFINKKELDNENTSYLWIASSIIIVCNIKFTGLAYAGCFGAGIYVLFLYQNFKNKTFKDIIKPTIIIASSVLLAVCVAGFQPYVTNLFEKGNPLYPLLGEGAVDIMTHNEPTEFHEMPTLKKFYMSIFAKGININDYSNIPVETKIPFSIYSDEIKYLKMEDNRMSGFGVLFSGIFVLSILIILVELVRLFKKNRVLLVQVSMLLVIIAALILFISESWWARYTPYVYFIPLIAVALLVYESQENHWRMSYAGTSLIILLSLLTINLNFYNKQGLLVNYEEGKNIRKVLNDFKKNNKKIIIVDKYDEFIGFLYNVDDTQLEYEYTTKIKSGDKKLFRNVYYREVTK